MHYSCTTATVLALLASVSYAQIGTVTITSNPCPDTKYEAKTFEVALNTVGVVQVDIPPLCGLTLKSSSSVLPITCQAFQDTTGNVPGSALFTAAKPALISTTPVTIKSLWCRNAQFNGASSVTVSSATWSASALTGSKTTTVTKGAPTITLGAPIGVSGTATARLAVPTGNATVTLPGGEVVHGNATVFTGGAVAVGAGVGLAGVAGLAALVL